MTAKTKKRTSDEMLDFEQVADKLNVSETSVRRLVSLGMLASVAVTPSGKKRMILVEELDRYIRRHNHVETPPDEDAVQISESRKARMKRAGWNGKSHL